MEFTDRWAKSGNENIHYLESTHNDHPLTPLIYVPGALNYAEQPVGLLREFEPRKWFSMSLRGRGKSDGPGSGYALKNHVRDIEAVVVHSQLRDYCLLAYSMGVPYAIKFASKSPGIKGLILCDYPAKYPAIPESWAERILSRGYIQKEKEHAVTGIQRESQSTDLCPELKEIRVPVLVIKGGTADSLLTEADTGLYRENLQSVKIAQLAESGHVLWEPDREKFLQVIKEFLGELDRLS
ncbi:alpha/beta hydrolase [Neobacillus notoginsengisoli]|uniref:Alpha/beta hydrolase n=2 Tax=Neobacillus notoginsengisoli TaxID=1578198 RepID=A0A417YZW0_9BACI|nr:alpha/beta hydrolase [Neobacillus notoginsengisoli]